VSANGRRPPHSPLPLVASPCRPARREGMMTGEQAGCWSLLSGLARYDWKRIWRLTKVHRHRLGRRCAGKATVRRIVVNDRVAPTRRLAPMAGLLAGLPARSAFPQGAEPRRLLQSVTGRGLPLLFSPRRRSDPAMRVSCASTRARSASFDRRLSAMRSNDPLASTRRSRVNHHLHSISADAPQRPRSLRSVRRGLMGNLGGRS
jgi:hypothetical protein